MNLPSISTDDTSLQHDFGFESLSDMSSPTLSEFSDIVAPIDNGVDGLPSPPSDPSDNSIADREPPVDTLIELDSFVPIIEHLPGLVLENNAYHVKRPLLKAELKQLKSYTRKIRELILTDATSTDHPSVAPETLARLALIQDPKSPFLPSLESLRLVEADEALVYFLFFCITPSLASLEISHIPSTRQITIFCYLEELVLNAPQLSNITLGPGRLSESSLQSSLKFVHLRHLHIINAADSFDFEFLRDVSSLPELESFTIDARTADYKQRLFQSDAASLSPRSSTEGPASFVEYQTAIATDIDSATVFPSLRKLAIIANVVLMGDLVYYLFPQEVKEVSLTLVQNGLSLQLPSNWDKRRLDVSPDNRSDPEGLSFFTTAPFPDSTSTTFAEPPAIDPFVIAQEVISIPDQPVETLASVLQESFATKSKKKTKKGLKERSGRREIEEQHQKEEDDARRKEDEAWQEQERREQELLEQERCANELSERYEQERRAKEWDDQEWRAKELDEREWRAKERDEQEWREQERKEKERKEEERLKAEEAARERLKAATEEERISNIISQTAFFAYVIEEILTVGNPDAFFVDRLGMSISTFDPIPSSIEFSSPTFRMLLSYPTLKKLHFDHWALTSVDESLVDLTAMPSVVPMSMEKLRLPVDASLNTGIMISTLHQIARYYPRLTHLESLVRQIPPTLASPLNLGKYFIPHGLKVLSVGGGSPSAKDKVNVATDLSLLFPYLETIKTHGGYDEDDWEYIHTLVKMCQTVRLDEKRRQQGL